MVQLLKVSRLLTCAELPLFLAIAPVLLFPTPGRALALLVVPLVWTGARVSTGYFVPPTPLNAAIWLLIGLIGASEYATFDLQFSLGKICGALLGIILFWAIARLVTCVRRLRLLVVCYLLAGAVLALLGVLGTDWILKFGFLRDIVGRLPRPIRGVPGAEAGFHPNAVAASLLLFIPLQITLLVNRFRRHDHTQAPGFRVLATSAQVVFLTLTASTLILTQSRSAIVSLILAGMCMLVWRLNALRRAPAVLVVVLAASLLISCHVRTSDPVDQHAWLNVNESIAGRTELWFRALCVIRDFPGGIGMNAFRAVMPVLYPGALTPADWDVAHAHNEFLQAALDLGLPGLVSYLAIWIVVLHILVRLRITSRFTDMTRSIGNGMMPGLLAYLLFGLTDAIAIGAKPGVLFWIALSLIVSAHRISTQPAEESTAPAGLHASSVRQALLKSIALARMRDCVPLFALAVFVITGVAPSISRHQPRSLLVLMPQPSDSFWEEVVDTLSREAKVAAPAMDVRVQRHGIPDFSNSPGRPDAIVTMDTEPNASNLVGALGQLRVPVLVLGGSATSHELKGSIDVAQFVDVGNERAGLSAALRMAEYVGGDEEQIWMLSAPTPTERARVRGFRTAAPPHWILHEVSDAVGPEGALLALRSLTGPTAPRAIFAATTESAVLAVRALRSKQVPRHSWPVIVSVGDSRRLGDFLPQAAVCATVELRPQAVARYIIQATKVLWWAKRSAVFAPALVSINTVPNDLGPCLGRR